MCREAHSQPWPRRMSTLDTKADQTAIAEHIIEDVLTTEKLFNYLA
jgi:hypothetical protein